MRAADSRNSSYRECKQSVLLWSHALQTAFFVGLRHSSTSFNHWVTLRNTQTHRITEQQMKLLWTVATTSASIVHYGSLGNKDDTLSAKVFLTPLMTEVYNFIWSVDSSAHLLTRTSNERNKSAGTLWKPMSGQWPKEPLHQVYLSISLCWKKVFMMQFVVPNMSIEVFQKDSRYVSLTLRIASLLSSTNFRYTALEFGPYTCVKHRGRSTTSTCILHPCGMIHQHNSPTESNNYLCTAWENYSGSTLE